MKKAIFRLLLFPLILLAFRAGAAQASNESPLRPAQVQIFSPSQLIEAVNNLRLSYGLPALAVHPILMRTAQSQADYMAATGNVTHARPGGMTYTQQLLSLGFPLAGDLSLGGFRSENVLSSYGPLVWDGVPPAWQDAHHMNTMLSQNFTHIGAGVSQSGEIYYYAVDTAAVTANGQMQSNAPAILTSVPAAAADASQYMIPVSISTALPNGDVIHTVQYGQSLWSIAIAYGTTIKSIQALNNLGENLIIYEGQRLLVLKAATQPASQTPASPPYTETVAPTSTPSSTPTPLQPSPTTAPDSQTSTPGPISSQSLVVVLIVVAFVGAGMAVWFIRDPASAGE